jgi:spore maturation protein CgeB
MLCGAMLLEKENNAISRWFTPMEDYVPFVNEDDLIDKIGYYLSRPQEMLQITLRALNKMRSNYSSKNWWVTVYEKAI